MTEMRRDGGIWQVFNIVLGVLLAVLGFVSMHFIGSFEQHADLDGHPTMVERVGNLTESFDVMKQENKEAHEKIVVQLDRIEKNGH